MSHPRALPSSLKGQDLTQVSKSTVIQRLHWLCIPWLRTQTNKPSGQFVIHGTDLHMSAFYFFTWHQLSNAMVDVIFMFHLRPVFLCGGDLVADSGFIGSEGFPSFYKANSRCSWRITVSHPPRSMSKSWLLPPLALIQTQSVWCPGPRGERGHALLPHFWLGGWLTVPLRLSGCLQRPFQLGAETGSLLWNFPAGSSYFNYKHHDAGYGDWWGDTGQRLCGLFQWDQAVRRWYVVTFYLIFLFIYFEAQKYSLITDSSAYLKTQWNLLGLHTV